MKNYLVISIGIALAVLGIIIGSVFMAFAGLYDVPIFLKMLVLYAPMIPGGLLVYKGYNSPSGDASHNGPNNQRPNPQRQFSSNGNKQKSPSVFDDIKKYFVNTGSHSRKNINPYMDLEAYYAGKKPPINYPHMILRPGQKLLYATRASYKETYYVQKEDKLYTTTTSRPSLLDKNHTKHHSTTTLIPGRTVRKTRTVYNDFLIFHNQLMLNGPDVITIALSNILQAKQTGPKTLFIKTYQNQYLIDFPLGDIDIALKIIYETIGSA